MILRFFFFLLIIIFIQPTNAQKLISGGKPKESKIDCYEKSFCVKLTDNYQVCKSADFIREETKYVILKKGEFVGITDAPLYTFACCEMTDFWAYRGDLDKDGSQEIIIASLESISNGMGISTFNIHIFKNPEKHKFAKPLTFSVQEFGEKGSLIFDKKKNETQVLVTYWVDNNSLDLKRGHGTYLIGKWFRYKNGLLKPVLEKPTLARRFLYSFGRKKSDLISNGLHPPYKFLRSKNTHRFFKEPRPREKLIKTMYGKIKSVETNENNTKVLLIELKNKNLLKGILSYRSWSKIEKQNTFEIAEIGLFKQNYVFPSIIELDVLDIKKFGRKVKLEIYQYEFGDKFTKLWFMH